MSDDDSVLMYLENEEENEPIKDNIILGIDLGTTNSCISIWKNNKCIVIPDENGNTTIPSYVSYTNISKYVGHEAKNMKDINTNNVFYEVKRIIGLQYNDTFVQECKNMLSYDMKENERGGINLLSTVRNNKEFLPEEISASVLKKLKDMATTYLGNEVKDVVITVPAHFNESQRQSTKDASLIAGLNCVRMINEPTAAAMAYGVNNSDKEKLILVYDFGGGTLDISIIDMYNGVFQVLGSSGISHFGGVDFDNRLMTLCMSKFTRQYNITDFSPSKLSRLKLQELRKQCERTKKILSTEFNASIMIENFYLDKDLIFKINRNDFENACRDYFLLSMVSVDELLKECDKTVDDINEVILVGGMTRVPHIREMLCTKFTKNKVNCSINPDEVVSMGASIQGYILSGRDDVFSNSITLLDVTPLSLGVEVIGGIMDILIKRNTMIPCEKTRLYTTDTDNMENVLIKIFEGERVLTQHNYKIGEFELNDLPILQKGCLEIEICFSVDLNGMVSVLAREKTSGNQKSVVINTNKNNLTKGQLTSLINEALEQETLDELIKIKKISHYEILDLCSNILDNNMDLEPEINDIKQWLKENRTVEEYEEMLNNIKNKYGINIMVDKKVKTEVKPNSSHLDATIIYSKDGDEEEDELRQEYEKVSSTNSSPELNDMKNTLFDLCKTINNIINSEQNNFSDIHKKEILDTIDDTLLWYHSKDNITVSDYTEKINNINMLCDLIVSKYDDIVSETLHSDKLEILCLKMLIEDKKNEEYLQSILQYLYTTDVIDQDKCIEFINEIEKLNVKTHKYDDIIVKDINNNDGLSIMELLKIKQNDELNDMIINQIY